MTGDQAFPPRGRLDEFYRDVPVSKRRRAADLLLLDSGMNLMAGNTRPSFFPIDVEIMEIPVAIPEIGQGGGPFVQDQRLFVALKTEGVKFRVKGVIERPYKIIFQQSR